jgi:hypothetical protein
MLLIVGALDVPESAAVCLQSHNPRVAFSRRFPAPQDVNADGIASISDYGPSSLRSSAFWRIRKRCLTQAVQ